MKFTDTAYLICKQCAWLLPILHTDENERCPECDGPLVVVDDHVLPVEGGDRTP